MKTEGCSPKDLHTLVARALQSSALRQRCGQQEGMSVFNIYLKYIGPLIKFVSHLN